MNQDTQMVDIWQATLMGTHDFTTREHSEALQSPWYRRVGFRSTNYIWCLNQAD